MPKRRGARRLAGSRERYRYINRERERENQKCTSKGIWRQGIVSKHRSSLQKEPMPCRHTPVLV